ncbi:MAG: molybdopterin molybdotransferase MoeA [Desulfobacterales bacterium]|nr:molybdopterin molybdotransferase MoeA [Desulfobacterales bacterium]
MLSLDFRVLISFIQRPFPITFSIAESDSMRGFFNVSDIDSVLGLTGSFPSTPHEPIPLQEALGRTLAEDVASDIDIPGFHRATMDGYAVRAQDTFGASQGTPAWLTLKGDVAMGKSPDFSLFPGEAAAIATGGMLPKGADAVVMVEQTDRVDETTVEIYKSVAPGHHIISRGEDFQAEKPILLAGTHLGPSQIGLLAAAGVANVPVHQRPKVGIISTGDEVVEVGQCPQGAQIRDINTHTLSAMVHEAGGEAVCFGIAGDGEGDLAPLLKQALDHCQMVLISGGSSVGMRDRTLGTLEGAEHAEIMVHGISISPGKPTILARMEKTPVWGLPGHAASAMVVFEVVVRPFLKRLAGEKITPRPKVEARLSRNIASAQGRTDFIRVRLTENPRGGYDAEPLLGKSGLIRTMVHAHGLIRIEKEQEGLYKESRVAVSLLP